jgi:hypothetical protein
MKKTIAIISFVLLILILAGIGFYILSLPPKEALSKDFKQQAITKLLGRKAQLDAVPVKEGNTRYNGKYISFEYPAKAIVYALKDPGFASSSALLEDFSFDIKSPRLILNMAVLGNSGRQLTVNDNPGVKLRQNSGSYKEQLITIDGQEGKVYEKNDEPEKTAFFLVNDKIYTISVTGSSFEEVVSLADDILKTVKFK